MTVDIDKLLIRCSSIGDIMTDGKTKSYGEQLKDAKEEQARLLKIYNETVNKQTDAQAKRYNKIQELGALIVSLELKKDEIVLGDTCTSKLKMIYRQAKWDREPNMSNKYTEKGLQTEQNAITLYSLHVNKFYRKNSERVTNAFLSGEWDMDDRPLDEPTAQIGHGVDVKSCWDWTTLPFKGDKLEKDYYWQDMGYMALTGAKSWTTVYCLVNSPIQTVLDAQKRAAYKLDDFNENTPEYIQECIKIEKQMIYDQAKFIEYYPYYEFKCKDWTFDIPAEERVIEFHVERDEAVIESIYKKIPICRKWIADNLV